MGNVYVAGKFEMNANFGGNTWVKCAGNHDVKLKTNANPGNLYQWIRDGTIIIGATNFSYTSSLVGSSQVKIIQDSCIS